MIRFSGTVRVAFCVAVLLASLSLVAWRQSRAFEALAALEEIRREAALVEAERAEMESRVRHLESRAWVVPEARERLGLRLPHSADIVYLEGVTP
ncbi:MAG: hypothetical protein ACOC7L_01180 [Acidobacteriota bacterium]